MSRTTREINKITSAIIAIALRIIIYTVLVLVLIKGIKIAYNFGHSIFYSYAVEDEPGRDIIVEIPEGATRRSAAALLNSKGLIDNNTAFIVQAMFFDYDIVPGTYVFNTSQTSREMLEMLDEGSGHD